MESQPKSCPVTATLQVIGGKWKPVILYILSDGTKRFSEIRRTLPQVTQKMLTQQLRELEADRIVIRTVYPEIPPRVEYRLSELGFTLKPVLEQLCEWGQKHIANGETAKSLAKNQRLAVRAANRISAAPLSS